MDLSSIIEAGLHDLGLGGQEHAPAGTGSAGPAWENALDGGSRAASGIGQSSSSGSSGGLGSLENPNSAAS